MSKGEKILALEVSDEKTDESEKLKPLVKEASRKVKIAKIIADGAYDAKDSFRYLDGNGIESVIKVGKGSSGKADERMSHKLVIRVPQ